MKKYKEFIIEDIFKCETTKPLIHTNDGKIPYVTRSVFNNGISKYIKQENYELNKSNCITIGAEGRVAFYQDKDFIAGVKIYTLRHNKFNKYVCLYICSLLNLNINLYSYKDARILDKIKKESIKLPIKENGEIDFEYMESYMKTIEEKTINKLNILKNIEKMGWGGE